jgi:hypothetical protein
MASTYTTSLKIQQIGNGEQSGTWGSTTNTNWNLIEQAVAGVQTITMVNNNYTLSNLNGVTDEARNMVLVIQGTNSAIWQVIAPLNQPKFYVVSNQTSGGYAITFGASTGAIITIPNGTTVQVYTDGTNFYSAQTSSAGNFNVNGNLTVNGTSTLGALTATTISGTTGTFSSTISGTTITASAQFSGPGTGLTGTAGSLSIGGNAATSTTATNIAGGAANQINYQTGSGITSFITAPTANTVLSYSGTGFVWTTGLAAAGGVVYENGQTITSNYTMTTGQNGECAGPITIATGVVVTIPSGSRWVIN